VGLVAAAPWRGALNINACAGASTPCACAGPLRVFFSLRTRCAWHQTRAIASGRTARRVKSKKTLGIGMAAAYRAKADGSPRAATTRTRWHGYLYRLRHGSSRTLARAARQNAWIDRFYGVRAVRAASRCTRAYKQRALRAT